MGTKPEDYTYVVFHQPNVKFPQRAAQMLGFKPEQYKVGLLVNDIGNTYAGSSLIGLTAILDVAKPGDRVLEVSFGSGAGSDAFSLRVTDRITERQGRAPEDPRIHRAPHGDRLRDVCAVSQEVDDGLKRGVIASDLSEAILPR